MGFTIAGLVQIWIGIVDHDHDSRSRRESSVQQSSHVSPRAALLLGCWDLAQCLSQKLEATVCSLEKGAAGGRAAAGGTYIHNTALLTGAGLLRLGVLLKRI